MPRRPGPPSPVQFDPTPLPPLLLGRDHAPDVVAAHIRQGRWTRVRRGVYLPVDDAGPLTPRVRALASIVALGHQLSLDHTVSHESAALLWGLPMVGRRAVTHLIQHPKPRSGRPPDVVRHVHELPDEHRTVHRGHPTTTLERTVVDCAMSLSPLDGLIIADAALHVGADRDACLAILAGMTGRRGVRRARVVLALADAGAESPGETKVRFIALRAGLPVPTTQVETETHLGTFWSDVGWEEWGLVVEYDGVSKYGAAGDAGAVGTVLREKRREDALVEAGRRMLRVDTAGTRAPDALVGRILRLAPPGTARHLTPRPYLT